MAARLIVYLQELIGVNILGSIYTTKAILPSMIRRQNGAVIFVSSQAGQLGLYGYSAYSATKYALRGLAETLQMELRPHSVHVSISFPPDTDTPQLQAELKQRDAIATELASFGNVFKADQIAKEVWSGAESGTFQITHGLDGFLLGTVAAGMSPAHSVWDALVQVSRNEPHPLCASAGEPHPLCASTGEPHPLNNLPVWDTGKLEACAPPHQLYNKPPLCGYR
jgi:3-dehydrosphinganine reductase